jgi:uncharacterized membrane protein
VNRFGEWGFVGVFSAVALASFALLINYFAIHRFDGVAGIGLAAIPAARRMLYALAVFGAGVMALSLFDYPVSAYALMSKYKEYEPRPIECISRHGFFSGLGLLAVAHALLATHLIGTVFFACLALFTWLGAAHQDAKLLAQRGEVHRRYMEVTSFLPFAAIFAGRQHLDLQGIPLAALAAAFLVPWLLRTFHDSILSAGGTYVIAAVASGAGIATLQSWRARHKAARRSKPEGAVSRPSTTS